MSEPKSQTTAAWPPSGEEAETFGRADYKAGFQCNAPDYGREDRRARWRIGWRKEQAAAGINPPGPLDDITIRYHAAMPNWCKLNGLDIKAVHPSEGGGFMVRRDQAEAIIALLQVPGVNEHGN